MWQCLVLNVLLSLYSTPPPLNTAGQCTVRRGAGPRPGGVTPPAPLTTPATRSRAAGATSARGSCWGRAGRHRGEWGPAPALASYRSLIRTMSQKRLKWRFSGASGIPAEVILHVEAASAELSRGRRLSPLPAASAALRPRLPSTRKPLLRPASGILPPAVSAHPCCPVRGAQDHAQRIPRGPHCAPGPGQPQDGPEVRAWSRSGGWVQ